MYSSTDFIPPRRAAFGQPRPAVERATEIAAMTLGEKKAVGEVLAGLINDESALYAVTREWRYDAAGRKLLRLHALLDEQFSQIGDRLIQLAARSRALCRWNSTGQSDRATRPRAVVANDALQAYILRELVGRHEALIAGLKRGSVASAQFHDGETTGLLVDLAANHEEDAFMLRALLWEFEKTAT